MSDESSAEVWACPVCREALVLVDKQACCNKNHRFDRARQGYYNLLLANQKNSADPGDTREMMLNRRAFLSQGHYAPLAEKLQQLLQKKLVEQAGSLNVFDSGCGEGYYLDSLLRAESCDRLRGYGLDISREAIKLAARAYPQSQWVVASSFHLPVSDASLDLVLRVFAPGDDAEVSRVLAPQGEFWRVAPGPNHLHELKAMLYDTIQPHSEPAPVSGFSELSRDGVCYALSLTSQASVQQLLEMTPFVWQSTEQRLSLVRALESLEVTVDFLVQRFTPEIGNE